MNKDQEFESIVSKAKGDPDVLGLVLVGGRGKGIASPHSDYDFALIVNDDAKRAAEAEYGALNVTEVIDGHVYTLKEFSAAGSWGSDTAWAAYGFAHLTALIDKTGEVQRVLDAKGTIPSEQVGPYVESLLDALINQYYRAFKNARDGNGRAAHLDAVEFIPLALAVLFGREGRVRPYNKFLEWELAKHPLKHLPWDSATFLDLVDAVLSTGDQERLKEIYRKVRDTSLTLGFEQSIKGWDGYVLE